MATITDVIPRPASQSGLWSWITTVDHKRIGVLYGATAFIFLLLGGIEAGVIRLQLSVPDNTLVNPDTFNQMFTMHGTTMIFLVIMPLSASSLISLYHWPLGPGTWHSHALTRSVTGCSCLAACCSMPAS